MSDLNCLKSLLKIDKNKKRLFFIIILLSMSLITILSICIYSASISYYKCLAESSGEQHAIFFKLSFDEQQKIINNSIVKDYGKTINVGPLKHNFKWHEYDVHVGFIDDSYINLRHIKVRNGSLPKKSNEIALEERVINILGIKPELNQNIEITVLQGNEEETAEITKTYKLVGILDDYFSYNHTNKFEYSEAITPSVLISEAEVLSLVDYNDTTYSIAVKAKSNRYEPLYLFAQEHNLLKKMFYNSHLYKDNGFMGLWFFSKYSKSYGHHLIASRLIIFLLALIICMIFSIVILTSIDFQNRKRQVGLIRAVGATQKQLTMLFIKNLLPIILKAMILGIIIGILLSELVYNTFESFLTTSYSIYFKTYNVNYKIIGLVFICGIVAIITTIHFSVKSVCEISPIKALRFNHKLKNKRMLLNFNTRRKSLCIFGSRSLKLNKMKTFLIVISLAISLSLSLTIITSYQFSNQWKPFHNNNSISIFNSSIDRDRADIALLRYSYDNKICFGKQDLLKLEELSEVKAIKTTNYLGWFSYSIAMKEYQLDEYLNIIKPVYSPFFNDDIEENYKNLRALGFQKDSVVMSGFMTSHLKTEAHGDYIFNCLSNSLSKGNINLDALKSGSEVILCLPPLKERSFSFDEKPDYSVIEAFSGRDNEYHNTSLKVGDTVSLVRIKPKDLNKQITKGDISNLELEEKIVKIGGIIEQGGYIQLTDGNYFYIDGPKLYVHNAALNKWLGVENYDRFQLILHKDVNDEPLADKISTTIIMNDDARVITSTFMKKQRNMNQLNNTLVYMSLILVTGIISFLTIYFTISSNLKNKQKQFAILRSIGMTRQQLKSILNFESLFYAVSANLLSTIYCIAYTVITAYNQNHPVEIYKWWQIVPWANIVIIALVTIYSMYLINNKQIDRFLEKSITDNIKFVN